MSASWELPDRLVSTSGSFVLGRLAGPERVGDLVLSKQSVVRVMWLEMVARSELPSEGGHVVIRPAPQSTRWPIKTSH
jgi:hypothetical protein